MGLKTMIIIMHHLCQQLSGLKAAQKCSDSSLGPTNNFIFLRLNKYSYFLTTNVCICASYLITFYAGMFISTAGVTRIDICIKTDQNCE